MKKNIFYLILLLSNFGFSQLSAVDFKSEAFGQFKASKTYIVFTWPLVKKDRMFHKL